MQHGDAGEAGYPRLARPLLLGHAVGRRPRDEPIPVDILVSSISTCIFFLYQLIVNKCLQVDSSREAVEFLEENGVGLGDVNLCDGHSVRALTGLFHDLFTFTSCFRCENARI